MDLIIKVKFDNVDKFSGEYIMEHVRTIEEHLDRWEKEMTNAQITGTLTVGYYTFREEDGGERKFQEMHLREVNLK